MKKPSVKKIVRIALINLAIVLITLAVIVDKGITFFVNSKNNEVVFINPSVIRTEEFNNSLPHNAEIIFLDKNSSGILQISEYLARKEDVDAIRILSHGGPGFFVLNGEKIDQKYIAENGAMFKTWKEAFVENADIMLYGCKVAATEQGRSMLKQLAELTGADVAAATHEVGGVLANWSLDYQIGSIETAVLKIDNYEFHLATQTVTNSNDSGTGSLREAISNAASGDEIIFQLNASNDTIKLTSGQLTIDKALSIDGDNTSGNGENVIISGNNSYKVFYIDAGTNSVSLKNLTVTKSYVIPGQSGAGIYNKASTLNLESVVVSENQNIGVVNLQNATINLILNSSINSNNLDGLNNSGTINTIKGSEFNSNNNNNTNKGGIYNTGTINKIVNCVLNNNDWNGIRNDFSSGTINKILNCEISGNTREGIFNEGDIIHSISGTLISNNNDSGIYNGTWATIDTIDNCVISGNTSPQGGGGIDSWYGYLNNVLNTTITGNTGDRAGGIYLYAQESPTTIKNTTISGNTSSGGMTGGLYVYNAEGAIVTLENSTIANNHFGGVRFSYDTFIVKNTIIANNYIGATNNYGNDYYCMDLGVTLHDEGYNIIGYQGGEITGEGSTFTDTTNYLYTGTGDQWSHNNGIITGTLNLATTLADNGGPTKTLAISSGSFADDALFYSTGDSAFNAAPDIDQRGYYRAMDGSPRDIGAYELGGTQPEDADHLSNGNGLWNSIATWSIYNLTDEWWQLASTAPADTSIVYVAINDTVTINAAATADSLVLLKGSKLEIGNNSTLTIESN